MLPFSNAARLAAAAVILAAGAARAESLVSLPEPDYASTLRVSQQVALPDRVTSIAYPTIGCPSIVEPGGRVEVVVLLSDLGTTVDWAASVSTSADPVPQQYTLLIAGAPTYDAQTGTYRLSFDLPPRLPEDTYDLHLVSSGLPGGARRAAPVIPLFFR